MKSRYFLNTMMLLAAIACDTNLIVRAAQGGETQRQIITSSSNNPAVPAPSNSAVIPVPKLEADSYDWWARHQQVLEIQAKLQPQIVLIGDSITHFWSGEPPSAQAWGPLSWKRLFGNLPTLNLGFGWDRTQNVLWRLDHGEFDGIQPRVVVLNIGSNNTSETANARQNTPAEIVEGIRHIILRVRAKAPHAKIILMAVFPREENPDHWRRKQINEINRLLAANFGAASGVTWLDIGPRLLQPDGAISRDVMFDFCHPTERGYQIWADALNTELAIISPSPVVPAGPVSTVPGEKVDAWHGYQRRVFTVDGCEAWIIAPKQPAAGNPWTWCLEFPDAFPERTGVFQLLEKGYYHLHIVVGNTFGCPEAVKHFDAFYQAITARGLAKKGALIGISRGGLYAYNWAARNPDKVVCVYGDAPVCDFKSWPGGKGKGKGSPGDWAALIKAYGFKDEAEALAYKQNPVDELAPLAKAEIPLIHVVGDADDVVPVVENTQILEERYQALGGKVVVIHKPGVGHHPHGLDDPSPVVKLICESTAKALNLPSPKAALAPAPAASAKPASRDELPSLRQLMNAPLRDTSICRGPDAWYLTGTVEPFYGFNEGMFIFKANGRYHLCCSEIIEGRYSCVIAMSTNLTGPYGVRYEAIPHAGHNTYFKDNLGQWWSTYFGSDDTAPWTERPGILPIQFGADGRVQFGMARAADTDPSQPSPISP
jgi:lysophospholipase L1-like esterase/pimeloyl-ACP methyl ester carboxylesterase